MSESESDTDLLGKANKNKSNIKLKPTLSTTTTKRDELNIRIASLQQENRVLKVELETYKIKVNVLLEENRTLRRNSVTIQAKAEQEEEYISNTLMKKINELKKEKETLVNKYETEEEFLTNELQRQLNQIKQEKVELEQTLEKEQEKQVNTLMRKIEKLKRETHDKHFKLEELRREKIELENTLEKEQEGLVNRLWKKMDKLETEKRLLQEKLNQPISAPPSPRQSVSFDHHHHHAGNSDNLTAHVRYLKKEVDWLRRQLANVQSDRNSKMTVLLNDERQLREENARLHRQLMVETERREALSRQLSESESSLEMDEESRNNLESIRGEFPHSSGLNSLRTRSISSPVPNIMARTSSYLPPSVAHNSYSRSGYPSHPSPASSVTSGVGSSSNFASPSPMTSSKMTNPSSVDSTAPGASLLSDTVSVDSDSHSMKSDTHSMMSVSEDSGFAKPEA